MNINNQNIINSMNIIYADLNHPQDLSIIQNYLKYNSHTINLSYFKDDAIQLNFLTILEKHHDTTYNIIPIDKGQ